MLSALLKNIWRGSSAPGPDVAAQAALDAGDFERALSLTEAPLRKSPDNLRLHSIAGVAALKLSEFDKALIHFARCIALHSDSAQLFFYAASAHKGLGSLEAARRDCEKALELEPSHGGAMMLYLELSLPGPTYRELLAQLHERLAPRTYIEIGVHTGASLAMVRPSTRAVGVDPEPKLSGPTSPNAQVYAMFSDDYFSSRDVVADLGGLPIDLAFIDGAHLFEQALRDFINIERYATPASTILLHDTYPLNALTADRRRLLHFWSGDVWRLVLALKKHRPDLVIANIATRPTGLCVVRGLDPTSRVLVERYETIVDEFMALDYSVLDADKEGLLNLVPNDLDLVMERVGLRSAATESAVR